MTTSPRVHWWISLALLLFSGLMGAVFFGPRDSLPVVERRSEDNNVLRVGYVQLIIPDPHRRTYPVPAHNQFILSLWEPLVECDPATGQPQPAAAQSWSWSADRKILTLKLRPDARWSNGDPVRAADFVRSWLRVLRHSMDLATTLFPLKNAEAFFNGTLPQPEAVGVQALDDFTLQVELDRPRATFVAELADPMLSPLHSTSETAIANHTYFNQPATLVTNGPFRLVRASYDGFRLEACEHYHDRATVRLAGVQFVRMDYLSTAPLLVAAGVVDLFSQAPSAEPSRPWPTARPVRVESELVLGVTTIDLNVTRGPLRDVRVRQALSLALDRVGAIEKLDPGHMEPANSWVPAMPGRAGLALLHENADEARRLLAAAGYPGGQGFPVLRMAVPMSFQRDPFPMAYTERWFQELGIRTYITYEPPLWLAPRLKAGDYDLFYGTLIATVPDAGDLLSTFLTPPGYSYTKWSDPAVVSALNQADAKNGEERRMALESAERLAMAALPTIPVMFERRQALRAAEVQGWYADPLGRQSFKRLWLESNPSNDPGMSPRS
ncbi:MAG: dppE [Lacunisphaera sp.]|nr:dppE [Lacunisphaera sp.]